MVPCSEYNRYSVNCQYHGSISQNLAIASDTLIGPDLALLLGLRGGAGQVLGNRNSRPEAVQGEPSVFWVFPPKVARSAAED